MTAFPPQLTLYYSPKACSLAAHIALEESGLPYAASTVNIRAQDNRRPEYLQLNPSGTVPALGIDAQVLTESQAILTYIADLVPERNLLPRTGTLARARAHQWMNLISSSLHVAYRGIFRPQSYGGESPEGMAAVSAQSHHSLTKVIQTVEERLGEQPYALGDSFSVVDAYLFVFYLWSHDERIQQALPARPRWHALAQRVWQRESVRKVVLREREVRAYDLPAGFALDAQETSA
ncbi:glutathione S-transferase family protein [Comamonas composti]|uniref:glutathione S-transferase family protein n=1 Tax=Comamonas composti TaxID=408558 RepID=UPI000403246A|nr:glutathione S-transferase N-terminal domain-containing protein [Comamonas composti]